MATQRSDRNEKLVLVATVLSATVAAVNLYIAYGRYKDYRDDKRAEEADNTADASQTQM